MKVDHDAYVAGRFDDSEARFKPEVAADDYRLRAVLDALGPIDGRRILDLGCGKGRFAAHLAEAGAEVVGLDLSAGMLVHATGIDRVRASAKRLPFADEIFDAAIAIEVFEHLGAVEAAIAEARRVLRPGGRLVLVDKNLGALDARRPWLPSVVLKWIDERRGLWMYPSGGPVAERWFWPRGLRKRLEHQFSRIRIEYLLRSEDASWWVFRAIPATRLMVLWSASAPETGRRSQPSLQKEGRAPWFDRTKPLRARGGTFS